MSPKEILAMIRAQPFEPVMLITSSGDRYLIHHPELAQLLPNGVLHIYQPAASDEATAQGYVRVSCLHIASIEPMKTAA